MGKPAFLSLLSSSEGCVCSAAQSCLTLCDPMDYNPPGSSVHGIFQARMLEWVAVSFSRESSGTKRPYKHDLEKKSLLSDDDSSKVTSSV